MLSNCRIEESDNSFEVQADARASQSSDQITKLPQCCRQSDKTSCADGIGEPDAEQEIGASKS